ETLRRHFNAEKREEMIFTAGTTHGINLVANGFVDKLSKGDEVIVSTMEHHSNIVTWQILCEKTRAQLKVIPLTEEGELDMPAFEELFSDKTRLVFVNHVSNALGTINPIKEIIAKAHAHNAAI